MEWQIYIREEQATAELPISWTRDILLAAPGRFGVSFDLASGDQRPLLEILESLADQVSVPVHQLVTPTAEGISDARWSGFIVVSSGATGSKCSDSNFA